MLRSLSIRDFVIVDHLDLEFDRGFGALTGETGAGKSILLGALGLALGGRGEAGMVMQIEPIDRIISKLKSERNYDEVIYTSPDGERFDQKMANRYSLSENLIILCGHYKGIDHRIREHLITKEITIGDFVLTGGELPAAIMTDAIVRLIPGAIGDEQSALSDSFQDNLLAPPVYTRPAEYKGWKVPDILLSGHQAKVDEWNHQQSVERTKLLRPDLLEE